MDKRPDELLRELKELNLEWYERMFKESATKPELRTALEEQLRRDEAQLQECINVLQNIKDKLHTDSIHAL